MPTPISYTFPADCPVAALRSVTASGGTPHRYRGEDVVRFTTRIDGQRVAARISDKPELQAAVAAYHAEEIRLATERSDLLARNLPGLAQVQSAATTLRADRDRYWHEHAHAQEHDMYRQPRQQDANLQSRYDALAAQYPRAAEYERLQNCVESAHWACDRADERNRMDALERGDA